ncbi:NAD+ synthetase [Pneumocystis murina B123]|uniref:Glutamine-dependent NAD(+) synthetase n=1 Tax=Pneumocystis murina (strain B123) TaxID=1069680 RepID=M7PIE6_PNEMU|nr:NAD+ synthetase [Pneumocystis murina B123]EMR10229.1 NAD+ synthetase [Pneumocystis murina B123]
MNRFITVAVCSLNQWALDFEGNCDRIIRSIIEAKKHGAILRIGPELEITGYGCYDHFLENDTYTHSWEMLCRILSSNDTQDIIIDIGMPVMHQNKRYNCRVILYNKKILLIRPKLWLANNGNYREMRYFINWPKKRFVDDFYLPEMVFSITGQKTVPIGDSIICTQDVSIGFEICEELFTSLSPHIDLFLTGVEIVCNSSGSHYEPGKNFERVNLIQEATLKSGGIYLYANQHGCDGDRLYYDGCSMIIVNGSVVAQGPQFSLNDLDVISATIDLEDVRNYRNIVSQGVQASDILSYNKIYCSITLTKSIYDLNIEKIIPSVPIIPKFYSLEEEIAFGHSCWLWDYLRKSNSIGFFLALSGGIDSCATALIVYIMCKKVLDSIKDKNNHIVDDLFKVLRGSKDKDWIPKTPEEFVKEILYTSYMATENSSLETRQRSRQLSSAIGSYHIDLNIDSLVKATLQIFSCVTGKLPKFRLYGGSDCENLAFQNLQARLRMVLSYFFAQLLPWTRGRSGSLIVLGSTNLDECLRGYFTKYDCSSADISLIGTLSKTDIRRFIRYVCDNFKLILLEDFLTAKPTAELEPFSENYIQIDEVDMGLTYDELDIFGKLRKIDKCGPYSMFIKLLNKWGCSLSPTKIAEKVKYFWFHYSFNRHKMTTLTPACHGGVCSLDDNRYDLRPFLYNTKWSWQFKRIDDELKILETGIKKM